MIKDLIAPCGMNCAVCSRYLSHKNKLKRSQCRGCRSRQTPCTYLFGKCAGINHGKDANPVFCFECDQYPCKHINRMDERYRTRYGMSVRDNLETIREKGLEALIEEQCRIHRCDRCGEMISVHNGKCFRCDPVNRLVEQGQKS